MRLHFGSTHAALLAQTNKQIKEIVYVPTSLDISGNTSMNHRVSARANTYEMSSAIGQITTILSNQQQVLTDLSAQVAKLQRRKAN